MKLIVSKGCCAVCKGRVLRFGDNGRPWFHAAPHDEDHAIAPMYAVQQAGATIKLRLSMERS
jgi:hypothetical protein